MTLSTKEITDAAAWDAFVEMQPESVFIQYSAYADFYRALGEESWLWGVYEGEILVGGSVVVSTHARRGNFLFLPYGPVLSDWSTPDAFCTLISALRVHAVKNGYDFIRVSPFVDYSPDVEVLFRRVGFRGAPMHALAETTWMLDVQHDDETLLAGMKKNHRNLIRRCIRDGVTVTQQSDTAALERLNDMHDLTAEKHNFHRFSRDYIEKEFDAFVTGDDAIIFEGRLPNEPQTLDATSIMMYRGTMGAYRHSASMNYDPKHPSSYLIQWEAIKEARTRGKTAYNFWGIAPDGAGKKHPFAGITHFKKGFGGYQRDLMHCQDLPVTWRYWRTWVVETFRRLKRGF